MLATKETSLTGRKSAPTIALDESVNAHLVSSKTRIVSIEEMSGQPPPDGASNTGHKKTRYMSPDDSNNLQKAESSGTQAPIVGFLVTFSWNPTGYFFPVREGKTTVGSDEGCDVFVREDRAMSGKHFAIMVRQGAVRVRDLESTNATRVDGQEVWADSLSACHGSAIQAGDTLFTLVLIPKKSAAKQGVEESKLADEG